MTTTTTVLEAKPFMFTGLEGLPEQDRSRLPRGRIDFAESSVVIAEGALEIQLWIVSCTLPEGYAYAIQEVHSGVAGTLADVANWDTAALGGFTDTDNILISFDGVNVAGVTSISLTNTQRMYTFDIPPKSIIVGSTGAAGTVLTVTHSNPTIGDAAIAGTFFASFMMYDIEQAHHVLVNTPQLVR